MVPLDGERDVFLNNAEGMTAQILNAKIAQLSETTTVNNSSGQ
jgi:hypothetical protein